MNCELISVGTELLTGAILNTNVQYLSEQLSDMGISVRRHITVGDNPKKLEKSLKDAVSESDIVILTGGLGPTQDDLTKQTAAEVFHLALKKHPELEEGLIKWFENREYTFTENNLRQAYIPEGAEVLENHHGTAPGILIRESIHGSQKLVFLLPGPPSEMRNMFEESVRPILEEVVDASVRSHYFHLTGIGESMAEDRILDLVDAQTNPTIATYAKPDQVLIRVTASAENGEKAEQLLSQYDKILRERFKKEIFSESKDSLTDVVGEMLIKQGVSVSCAESLTAGLLTSELASVPGISSCLLGGITAYSCEMKEKLLGVPKTTLDTYGAVSDKTAKVMAQRIRLMTGSDVGLATTGVAGPDPSEGKPVGLVYTAISTKEGTSVQENFFSGTRNEIRKRSVLRCLRMLRNYLQKTV